VKTVIKSIVYKLAVVGSGIFLEDIMWFI